MKKKITALCLVVALALVAIGGATMAYFTDKDQQNNTFAIGNIDIKVDEYGYVWDKSANNGQGGYVTDAVDYTDGGMTFTNIMPSYIMSKRPIISNESTRNAAYVRVAVVVNNLSEINTAIDGVYEEKDYTEEQIQAIYDDVFAGWGISHLKTADEPRRMWMKDRDDSKVLGIDMAAKIASGEGYYTQFSITNMFKSEAEKNDAHNDGVLDAGDAGETYYSNALSANERVYVFYLKLDANESYELFGGLNAPADFNNEQMKMFEGLQIGIYADAIQTVGFSGENAAIDAFTALEAEHPLGWWNAE